MARFQSWRELTRAVEMDASTRERLDVARLAKHLVDFTHVHGLFGNHSPGVFLEHDIAAVDQVQEVLV